MNETELQLLGPETLEEGGKAPVASPYPEDPRFKVQTIRCTGAVYLYGPELDIIDSPEFQRLQGIKQLGTSYFVFRGAVHTRFEHSLGTLQMAEQIVQAVNNSSTEGTKIDRTGRRVARLAALLHDLPHVPFGHTLEDEFGLLKRHDENQPRLKALLQSGRIHDILEQQLPVEERNLLQDVLGLDAGPEEGDKDSALAKRLGEYAYVADIVANTVCADALDYIVRDLSACGLPVALGDRFLDFFDISPANAPIPANQSRMALRLDKRGMPRPDVESEIIKLLTYRYELAERVFFHHAKNAASVMIGEAVRLLELHKRDENFHGLSDETLLAVLAHPESGPALGLKMPKVQAAARDCAAELGQLVLRRHFYKLAYLGVADDDTERRAGDIFEKWGSVSGRVALQEEIAARAGVDSSRVLVHLPTPKMMAKLARVRVLLEHDTVITFEEFEERHSGRVQALNRAHERLWRVGVYLHPDDHKDEAVKRLVGSAAIDLFGIRSRYVEPEVDQPYLEAVFDLKSPGRWDDTDRERTIKEAARAAASSAVPRSLQAAEDLIEGIVRSGRTQATEGSGSADG